MRGAGEIGVAHVMFLGVWSSSVRRERPDFRIWQKDPLVFSAKGEGKT